MTAATLEALAKVYGILLIKGWDDPKENDGPWANPLPKSQPESSRLDAPRSREILDLHTGSNNKAELLVEIKRWLKSG